MQDRRTFLEQLGAGAMLATLPTAAGLSRGVAPAAAQSPSPHQEWDTSWARRITGKYRAVFDVPEIESGYGVWRASLWERQYSDVLGAQPADLSAVLVIRHTAIALAMKQSFWDQYDVAGNNEVMHPISQEKTDRNPVLLTSAREEVPAMFDDVMLDRFLARGGIVLACNLAFDDMIQLVVKKDGGTPEAARAKAVAGMVPGVIMQPSGVFASLYAQEFGCRYLRAS